MICKDLTSLKINGLGDGEMGKHHKRKALREGTQGDPRILARDMRGERVEGSTGCYGRLYDWLQSLGESDRVTAIVYDLEDALGEEVEVVRRGRTVKEWRAKDLSAAELTEIITAVKAR